MKKMKQTGVISKNAILTIAGLVILLVIIFLAAGRQTAGPGETGEETGKTAEEAKEFAVTKKEVPVSEAPAGFPAEVPLEEGATIVQNYEADTTDGRHQATRTFESSRTVAQNYQTYLNFLEKNGWEITNKFQAENIASVFGKKAEAELSATVSENTVTGVVTVELTYITSK